MLQPVTKEPRVPALSSVLFVTPVSCLTSCSGMSFISQARGDACDASLDISLWQYAVCRYLLAWANHISSQCLEDKARKKTCPLSSTALFLYLGNIYSCVTCSVWYVWMWYLSGCRWKIKVAITVKTTSVVALNQVYSDGRVHFLFKWFSSSRTKEK